MIGFLVTFGVMSALAGACWCLGAIAQNARQSTKDEPLWPDRDRSWG